MTENLFSKRLRYFFDKTIASGTGSLLLWIAGISFVMVAAAALILTAGVVPTGEDPTSYAESFWSALNMALDPGAVEDPGWPYRALMLTVAILGILIVSTLIGILTSGIEGKLEELRRGRSEVLESNHSLILGWSSKLIPVIKELVIANENQSDGVIVILADRDKVEMEEELKAEIEDLKSTRIICRSGNPADLASLEIVNPKTAKSFIILREEVDDPDDEIIKSILAVKKICGDSLTAPLVAEMTEPGNTDAALTIDPFVSILNASEVVVRIIAQASREPGLSLVYEEILSFAGSEIYFKTEPAVENISFADATTHYNDAIIIGLLDPSGIVHLAPPPDQLIKNGEKLIAIAEDDDQINFSSSVWKTSKHENIPSTGVVGSNPEKFLILGWNSNGNILLKEFDDLLPDGSEVMLIYNEKLVSETPTLNNKNSSITWSLSEGDTTNKELLELSTPSQYDHVIVLSYRDKTNPQKSDSKTLLTLIHLRNIKGDSQDFTITSELIDARHRDLIQEEGEVSDFVASEELASKALVQISENHTLKNIFDELLTAKGYEFHLRPVGHFKFKTPVTFADVTWKALMRGEIAIGVRNNGEVSLNPSKSKFMEFSEDAAVVVLSED